MEPEITSSDTASWRGEVKQRSPLAVAIAKEFDFNIRSLKSFVYYSILLGIFAKFGTTSKDSSKFLIALVPCLWISKLRQLRLILRFIVNALLPIVTHIGFLLPLLPAPHRVMAEESYKWIPGEQPDTKDRDGKLRSINFI